VNEKSISFLSIDAHIPRISKQPELMDRCGIKIILGMLHKHKQELIVAFPPSNDIIYDNRDYRERTYMF
ncbi:hypothetical protein ACJX0J_027667, partial [Zea mays]